MRITRTWLALVALVGWVIVIALAVAMVRQDRAVKRDRRALLARLYQTESRARASETLQYLFADHGFAVLEDVEKVELLQIAGPTKGSISELDPDAYRLLPTGTMLREDFANRLAGGLLNPENYLDLGADDLPEPQFGLRCKRGPMSLDILVGLGGHHADVWSRSTAPCGVGEWHGWICLTTTA